MRVIIHQAIKTEDMARKEPKQTKMIPFVSDKTNMYINLIGGGIAILFTPSYDPARSWDGFIFDRNSDKLLDGMIKGLQWIKKHKKGIYDAQDKARQEERSRGARSGVPELIIGAKASKSRKKRAGAAGTAG